MTQRDERMLENENYFAPDKADSPYRDGMENLADYFALIECIADWCILWRDESDEDENLPPRGIRISDKPGECADVIRSVPFADRKNPIRIPEISNALKYGFDHIIRREIATEDKSILRMRSIIDAFLLTKRQTMVLLLLCSARRDVHMLEAFSYFGGDKTTLKKGALSLGLIDTILHLAFEYEEVQAEAIADPDGKLMRYLISVYDEGGSTLHKRLEVNDIVYRYLMFGRKALLVKPVSDEKGAAVYYEEFAKRISSYEKDYTGHAGSVFCYIRSKDPDDVTHVLTKVFAEYEIPLFAISSDDIRRKSHDLFFSLSMEGYLRRARVLVTISSEEEKDSKKAADIGEKLLFAIGVLKKQLPEMNTIYLTGTENIPPLELDANEVPAVLELELPDIDMRVDMWKDMLKKHELNVADDIDIMDIADCHEISFGQIKKVVSQCASTLRMTPDAGKTINRQILQKFIFALSTADFDYLATPVEARYTWDDIFLEENQKKHLKYACDRYRLRNRIGAQWEINKKNAYGNAVIMLMYGPPGTGKTMAAQVVANEVMTPLYRVDVSQIFSKYIGETQKNISKIFEEAQKRSVVLFFDEADALFTRRTEIKDSHDKYANSDTSFLLQKVEEYNGISILATNNFQSFDPAFMRRLTYVIRFERPDEKTRKKMWHSMMSEKVPVAADVDLDWLAEHFDELTGSNIKSIIMTACYMAAGEGKKLTMRHLLHSVRLEFDKLGRLMDPDAFGQYAMLLID